MTIQSEVQKLYAGGIVQLLEVDTTYCGGTSVLRLHGEKEWKLASIFWRGQEYTPYPIEIEGLEVTAKGTMPRPTLKCANMDGLLKGLTKEYDDLVGAKVTLRRTFTQFLDAVNFPDGNPQADPTAEFPVGAYYVERKVAENDVYVEFELVSAIDLQSVKLPQRQITTNYCTWKKYRGAECGYTGTNYFDANDNPTTADKDVCGKRLGSCKLRFGVSAELPFGGFPGARLYRM